MPNSYQNARPRTIQELGMSDEELGNRKTNRRLLFSGIAIFLVLSMSALGYAIHRRQIQIRNQQLGIQSPLYDLAHQTATSVESGCETTILIIRHCEKEGAEVTDRDGNKHCSYLGFERSHFLPTLFGESKWPVPSELYALGIKRLDHFNFREIETLVPLAEEHSLTIQSDFDTNEELTEQLFKRIAKGTMCGKTAVVSWKHNLIGDLAAKLGCSSCPSAYPDGEFDQVWQLKLVYDVMNTSLVKTKHVIPDQNESRQLRNKTTKNTSGKRWTVYPAVVHQHFDPLKFSFASGDYSGSAAGGKWYTMDEEGAL